MLNTSNNTNATENDINQLTDVYVMDVENNFNDTNDDYVFYSEDSLVGSTCGSISNNPSSTFLKGILKQDTNSYNFLDNNLQVFAIYSLNELIWKLNSKMRSLTSF